MPPQCPYRQPTLANRVGVDRELVALRDRLPPGVTPEQAMEGLAMALLQREPELLKPLILGLPAGAVPPSNPLCPDEIQRTLSVPS